jgi:Protein of unknown function (DUF1573)
MNYFKSAGPLVLGLLFVCCAAPKAQTPAAQAAPATAVVEPATPLPWVKWDKNLLDLGVVKKGEKRAMAFEFANTSGMDIKIYHVDACECTTVDFPRGIIPAGEKRRIDAVFDSEKKDAGETISINIFLENPKTPNEPPRMEEIKYKFELKQ